MEQNAVRKNVTEYEMEDFLENVYTDEKAFKQQRLITRVIVIVICVLLVLLIVRVISVHSSRFDDTVTDFSDDAPRVGNNIYGYIDVPEGFGVTGSFNPADVNYAGGADGIAEGVQLKNEKGTMYIIMSLVTSDKRREDYVGFGDGISQLYGKKRNKLDMDQVFDGIRSGLLENELLTAGEKGLLVEGELVDVNGLSGMSMKWKGNRGETEYQYQTYIIENPQQKGVFHCVTAAFTSGYEQCVDYVQTFSLSSGEPQAKQFVGVEDRVGSKTTGYINIPKGFREYKGVWYYELADDFQTKADLKFFASEDVGEKEAALFEGMVLVGLEKSEDYDTNPVEYMETNLQETYGYFNLLDYFDMSNVKLQGDSKEFGARAFLSVLEQTLGVSGTLKSETATVDGNQGYRVTWNGRGALDRTQMYLSFYILENSQNPDVVYIVGAKERTSEGQFWQYLDSFKADDKFGQLQEERMVE